MNNHALSCVYSNRKDVRSMMFLKKMMGMTLALILCLSVSGALACTSIYVGGGMSDSGAVIFGRSEDYSNSQNKLFYVSPAGNHTAGEEYAGCYGFTWTFTHDSYSYTAFSDDNGAGVDNVCPDCGGTHVHTPYEAAGTNEKGLSVTATETIGGLEETENADPYEDLGIEEAEIVTVLLSEAATAKEAVQLLAGIYDTQGANNGSGIFIGDAQETWYIENVTGHQYIAVKLSPDMVMVQPNMSVIGLIDLDDTENVIASAGLIEVAKAAGTYVGSEEDNTIDYVGSYNGGSTPNARMVNALKYLDPAFEGKEAGEIDAAASYLISNVKDGEIVPMYTGITPAGKLGIADVQGFYHISNIGQVRNLENHIFVISDDSATGTVEWACMNDSALGIYVPYYPMLTTDVLDAYKLSTATAEFVTEQPTEGVWYPTTAMQRVNGERVQVEGFKVLPENWKDSMYWVYDALSNTVMFCGLDDAAVQGVYDAVYAKQAEINEKFAAFAATFDGTAESATAFSMELAQEVFTFGQETFAGIAK